ncbi:probable 4-coumarate--CoA ligase 3 isoform X1 [Sycon ciliatum]|uniref:probable 4-coumarate--CoA ligase 3 isoform X1 n=1 Tax=Sycon ciliatum TaxID=27933 RepID=UPI0031F6A8A5
MYPGMFLHRSCFRLPWLVQADGACVRNASASAALRPNYEPRRSFKLSLADDQRTVRSPFPDVDIPSGSISAAHYVLDGGKRHARSSDIALVDCLDRVALTYGDLRDMHEAFRCSLVGRGIQRGDVALFYLHNCPEFAVCLYGCLSAGVRVSPCNHAYGVDELAYQIQRTQPKLIVTFQDGLETVSQALCKASLHGAEVVLADLAPEGSPSAHCTSTPPTPLADFLNDGQKYSSPDRVHDCMRDTAILPFSSGTTGAPKPIALSHHNLIANICQQTDTPGRDIFNHHGYHGDNRPEATVGVMPFFHIYGLTVTLGSALLHGGKVVTMAKFQPDLFLQSCAKHRVSQLHFVPPLTLFMAQDSRVSNYDLSSVKSIFCGAAPMGEELARQASQRLNGAVVRQGYGMTELSPICMASPLHATKYGSVGVPVPNTEVRVVDIESGKLLGAGENGEIRIHGPQVMQGYVLDNGDLDRGVDSDGFLPTGDIGHYDEDGYFFIVDRLKEIMKVKGFQVAPAELEAVLLQHDGIEDVGVTGIADHRSGEAPLAFVVRSSSHANLTESDVQDFVASRLAKHKHLTGGVRFVDSIPKTLSGKILRRELKEIATTTSKKSVHRVRI